MVYSVEIININADKFRFQEGECRTTTYNMTSKLLKQSLPDADPKDAIVINLGREKSIIVPFQLRVTTDDAAAGTHTSTVKTIQEKVDYLIGTFITNGLEDLYTVNITTSVADITDITGIVENFSLDFNSDKPNTLNGNITISVGGGSQ